MNYPKLQCLILCYLFSSIIKMSDAPGKDEAADGDLPGVLSLLCKYVSLISCHINEVLPVASSIAEESPRKLLKGLICNTWLKEWTLGTCKSNEVA